MNKTCDILVVGSGILGAATAYHLKQKHPGLDILIVDRKGVAQGNTCKSVAMLRDTFTSPPSHALATATIEAFKDIHKATQGGIELNRMMYLWLFTEQQAARNAAAIAWLQQIGVDVAPLDAATLADYAPPMTIAPTDEESQVYGLPPLHTGLLCRNGYSVDPIAITQWYVDQFKALGGRTAFGVDVVDLLCRPLDPICFEGEEIPDQPFPSQVQRVSGVRCADGDTLSAGTTILATGAWSRELTDKLGRGSLLSPKKRQWFYIESADFAPLLNLPAFGNEDGTLPFTILPQGIYMKPSREGGFYVAFADDLGRGFNLDVSPERHYYINAIYPFIKGYFPAFEKGTIKAMDAGSYCYDEVYRTPIVDWLHTGLMLVSGGSGSGIMKADAVGRAACFRYELGVAGDGQTETPLNLPGGGTLNTDSLTVRGRGRIEPERLVI